MMGKWASSCVDFGYTELFCIPELTSEFISSCDSVLGDSLVFYQENWASLPVIRNSGLLCTQCREMKPHLPARGMCHGVSRVAAGTWGIFSSYTGDGHSKLHFVHWSQESCLVMMDTSGIYTRLERILQTLLEVRWDTKRPFLVSRKILGLLLIFKRSQASSALKLWTPWASRGVNRCEAPCPDEAGN